MLLNHAPGALAYDFDDPNLIGSAGLLPVMRLAEAAGLSTLAPQRLSLPGDKGANSPAKIASLVAGMAAGADSIDDMGSLRHGAMPGLFKKIYAPSTLGSFLREFSFGHVRQLDALSSRLLAALGSQAPLLPTQRRPISEAEGMAFVDIDDTVIEVHSAKKQGAGFGYSGKRGLNALLVTASTAQAPPVIIGQRLRKGAAHSARGASKTLSDALATVSRVPGHHARVVVRADSAYYSARIAETIQRNGADLSITVRMNKTIQEAIRAIPEQAWQGIEYPQAIYDEATGSWISSAEVAEVPFTAFTSKKNQQQVTGRLIVRRVSELNQAKLAAGQDPLFDAYRHHGFFTTISAEVLDTVAADKTHRQHAVIEQVNAELKAGPLARMPSGVFNANAAWLTLAVISHNLLRAAGSIAAGALTKARALSIRQKLINIPARIASHARKLTLHLPQEWKWAQEFARLYAHSSGNPPESESSP
ncbi:IS1380 family transposase [Nesterenkonia suensis]